jgi:hypothetical protein
MLIFLQMFPNLPNFNPPKRKQVIAVCGAHQLIVNTVGALKTARMAGAGFYSTK